ncbi:MAG TPA: hypothetical protein VND64_20405 [Pirellulales bacterium]|nr:hypothetical protein [Pirellulales bacterium]
MISDFPKPPGLTRIHNNFGRFSSSPSSRIVTPLYGGHQGWPAHFRLLPSTKVTFVRQATVRPDLPAPERGVGYRVQA